MKALEKMKLEVSQEITSKIVNGGKIGGRMTHKLVEMGEKELIRKKEMR